VDVQGIFKLFLEQQGMKKLGHLKRGATFHIQVLFSRGEITSAFYLSPQQVHKGSTNANNPFNV
jgi:hypothetical protein